MLPGKAIDEKIKKPSRRRWDLASFHQLTLASARLARLYDRGEIDDRSANTMAKLFRLTIDAMKAERTDEIETRIKSLEDWREKTAK